jgi:hypothetical protein
VNTGSCRPKGKIHRAGPKSGPTAGLPWGFPVKLLGQLTNSGPILCIPGSNAARTAHQKVTGEALATEEKELILSSNELMRKRCWDEAKRVLELHKMSSARARA